MATAARLLRSRLSSRSLFGGRCTWAKALDSPPSRGAIRGNHVKSTVEPVEGNGTDDPETSQNEKKPAMATSVFVNAAKEADTKYKVLSRLKPSDRHNLAMIFTCKVCDTRSVKTVCRESYEKGVVIARCDGCNNLHLIADRLGWFGEPGSVEDFLAARGEVVKKGSADTLNLTLEDFC